MFFYNTVRVLVFWIRNVLVRLRFLLFSAEWFKDFIWFLSDFYGFYTSRVGVRIILLVVPLAQRWELVLDYVSSLVMQLLELCEYKFWIFFLFDISLLGT